MMASSQDDNSEWDKRTSEIQSEDSEDLFASRPNRWRGPPQSWRALTEEDRLTYNALERLQNQDLSVHLYNAFALKNIPPRSILGDVSVEDQHLNAETVQDVHTRPWEPPRSWTAWPLPARLLPPDNFMKKTEDEDEGFTFRRVEREAPSIKLEEVISAAVLRYAKDRFRKRTFDETRTPGDVATNIKKDSASSENESLSSEAGLVDERKESERVFKPAVATDDDLSYKLIRPTTRAIIEKLDRTFAVLHNARMSSTQDFGDDTSSSEDENIDDTKPRSLRSQSRSRATSRASTERARSRSMSLASTDGRALALEKKGKSRRGRKPTSMPREGETEREFLIRRAKEQKKKRPVFSDEEDGGTTTAAESAKSPRRGIRRTSRRRESIDEIDEYWMQKKLDKLNLRDWSDVMGAAALAGFSPKVIERATQRCANLFRQGMEMHTIAEDGAVETRRYLPGEDVPPRASVHGEHENDDLDVHQVRSAIRVSGASPSRAVSPETDHEENRGRRASINPQRRSGSRVLSTGPLFCPHADCDRATRAFDRPYNLRRHLKGVHGDESPGVSDEEGRRDESPRNKRCTGSPAVAQHFCPHVDCKRAYTGFDRMYNLERHLKLVHGDENPASNTTKNSERAQLLGGVHRDGHLELIRVQKGWRTGDTKKRAQRTSEKRRRESEPEDRQSTA